jgi:ubiquinone biosynthesis protein
VREWIERNLGPVGRVEDVAEGAVEVGRFLGGVPELLARGGALVEQIDAITRNGLILAPETVADIGSTEARRNRWMAGALWVIAALLAWLIFRIGR